MVLAIFLVITLTIFTSKNSYTSSCYFSILSDAHKPPPSDRKSSLFTTNEITLLLSSSELQFDDETNRMSATDLDLTQRTIEAEIRVRQIYLQHHDGSDEKEYDLILNFA